MGGSRRLKVCHNSISYIVVMLNELLMRLLVRGGGGVCGGMLSQKVRNCEGLLNGIHTI